jgi:serine/threonine-protein kinase
VSNAQLLDRIFTEALEVPAAEREAFVKQRCGADVKLATKVLKLIALSARPNSEIEDRFNKIRNRLWHGVLSRDDEQREDLSGSQIGTWSVEKLIARGGLATVYKAQRSDGVFHQQVALKVLRRGLDTEDLIGRFHAEREILSSLEHPGIAKILDGGALDDGRPFLVLEYIDGLPITEHCEKYQLGIRARMQLVIDVSHAIGHAHRRLIVHRDIKPSNILVSNKGKVSVLDFGIAKLLDPLSFPTASPKTRTGMLMLTPAYASPEQHAAGPITTASDIYQLGLIIFQLLTGEMSFAGDGNHDGKDLPLPSQCIPDKHRRRQVTGDLDAIVHKAAHVDANLRYSSAEELVADLNRFLNRLPVQARPDTWRYRLGKFNKRKPWLMPLLAVAVIAITSYVVTLSLYSKRLANQQQLTLASQEFLVDLFKSPDPFTPADAERGRSITVIDALEIGHKRVRSELADQPELRLSLLGAISEVYASLEAGEMAIDLREEVLQLERSIYGERSPQVVASMRALGGLYSGRGDREKAAAMLDRQLSIAVDIFSEHSPELGLSEIAVGMEENQAGNHKRSLALLQSGVEKLRPETNKYARKIISVLITSGEQQGMGSQEATLQTMAEAQEIAVSVFGETSLLAAMVRLRIAATLTQIGDYAESERNFLASVPVLESQLGEDHSVTLNALNNLGYLYTRSGQQLKGERMFRELLERQIAKNGLLHRFVADSYQNLAGTLTKQGRYNESIPLHRKAYDVYKSVLDDDHYIIAFPLLSIAFAELQLDQGAEAELTAREALSRFEATVPGSFLEGVAQCLVGLSLEKQGRINEGNSLVYASHELMKKGSIPDPYPDLCRLTGL